MGSIYLDNNATMREEIDQVLEILPVIVNDLAPRGVSV